MASAANKNHKKVHELSFVLHDAQTHRQWKVFWVAYAGILSLAPRPAAALWRLVQIGWNREWLRESNAGENEAKASDTGEVQKFDEAQTR